jgi:SAM-dependent MidA family methyltransferase
MDDATGSDLGLRRHDLPDPAAAGEDAALVARIRDEIAAGGPMPFVRFMDLALYDPQGGYYRAPDARPGRAGDFVTAPELHPIFGRTLARAVLETWEGLGRPDPFVVQEHGAGEGAMAMPLLEELATTPLAAALRYHPVEIDDRRVATLTERVAAAGLGATLLVDAPSGFDGLILANEVLDALPVHRVRLRGERLVELAVMTDSAGTFVETEIEPTTDALATRLADEGIRLVDGQTAEICLALDDWIAAAAAPLRRGLLVAIDYGAPAIDLYDPIRRRDGTLRAYVRQTVHADPYRHVGRQDLTAHVDVSAVERAAHRAGLTTVGITTQAEALMGLGIEARLQAIQADRSTTMEAYREVRGALMRLLDPAAMGRFRVMAFGRDWPSRDDHGSGQVPPLGLFTFRLPERVRRRT